MPWFLAIPFTVVSIAIALFVGSFVDSYGYAGVVAWVSAISILLLEGWAIKSTWDWLVGLNDGHPKL